MREQKRVEKMWVLLLKEPEGKLSNLLKLHFTPYSVTFLAVTFLAGDFRGPCSFLPEFGR